MNMNYRVLMVILTVLTSTVMAQTITTPKPPQIAANSYLLMDFNSETLLAEFDVNKKVEPASITKMMTAYVVFSELKSGNLQMGDLVTVSEKAWRTGGSKMFIEVNKKVSIENLVKGMIIQSGNDACVALAEHIAGSEETFADLMNQHAVKIGMQNSNFINATGLPAENHYITAMDAAKLAKAIILEFPDYFEIFSEKEFTFNKITQHNRNTLLWRDPSVDGFKTGHTEAAGYCLVATAKRNGMRLITVVMGTESQKARADESQKLFNYGYRFFETNLLYKANEKRVNIEVWKGVDESVDLGLAQDLYITIPRGQYNNLQAKVDMPNYITAPISKKQIIGQLNIQLHDKVVAVKNLVALKSVQAGGWWTRMTDGVGLWFKSFGDDDE
ncbi:MAG TPA: D-alanyl-D-alanine carboxypeptidase [Oceanospirillales bacterium]|nr:D-alanyl-D-alanine carboxypeptidase [Oceanospirillales bacterium]